MSTEKDLNYWKENAEEDYKQVPISVLRYITELETLVKNYSIPDVSQQRVLLKAFQKHYEKTLRDDFIYDDDIDSFLKDFNCG